MHHPVTQEAELAVRIDRTPGALDKVIQCCRRRGVGIKALCTYASSYGLTLLIVPTDGAKAIAALETDGYSVTENEVLVVSAPYHVSLGAVVGSRLSAAHIEIFYSYAYWSEDNQFVMVYRTGCNDLACHIIEEILPLLLSGADATTTLAAEHHETEARAVA